jgi:hypothetical protein
MSEPLNLLSCVVDEIKVYGIHCTVPTQAQPYIYWMFVFSILHCICTTSRGIQHMYNSAYCVKAAHITCLPWQTVIYTKDLIILHAMCAVTDLQLHV